MADGTATSVLEKNHARGGCMTSGLPEFIWPLKVGDFVGRQAELDRIEAKLWDGDCDGVAIVPASARAPDGVGKTSIAIEYAVRHGERYVGICWIDARHGDSVPHQLIARACLAAPHLQSERRLVEAQRKAREFFSRQIDGKPWLVIYDDLDDSEGVRDLLPECQAHVLITSSRAFWPAHIATVPVDVFPTEVAAGFLIRMAACTESASANALALQLGYLPLALRQAADYCRRTNTGASTFAAAADAWTIDGNMLRADSPVFATSGMALDQIKIVSADAESLMNVLAMLGGNGIRRAWFKAADDDAFALLDAWGLISTHTGGDGQSVISIHPLVQQVVKQRAGAGTALAVGHAKSEAIVQVQLETLTTPARGRQTNWVSSARLLPHALCVLDHGEHRGLLEDGTAEAGDAGKLRACVNRLLDQHGGSQARTPIGAPRHSSRPVWRVLQVLLGILTLGGIAAAYFAIREPEAFRDFISLVERTANL